MLWSIQELRGMQLVARDGDVGTVRDVYFDDARWAVRYLVVHNGGWLGGRNVLVSPHAVEEIDRVNGRVKLSLTRRQIESSPSVGVDKPVSRQQETDLHEHYGHPPYWIGSRLWGGLTLPLPMVDAVPSDVDAAEAVQGTRSDPHLRSAAEVVGYALQATDGTLGRVDDFLFEGRSWAVEHLVVVGFQPIRRTAVYAVLSG